MQKAKPTIAKRFYQQIGRLNLSSPDLQYNYFGLFGFDFGITQNFTFVPFEINMFPSVILSDEIDKSIKEPLV